MNEKETIKILATIAASYPSVERLNEAAIQGMAKVWARMFKDDDARLVGLAVGEHIATSKFPPSVAEIREKMVNITHPELISPDQAWPLVRDTMHALGQFADREKIAAVLPPLVFQAVNDVGWTRLWQLYDPRARGIGASSDKLAFMEFYKPAYERERTRLMLPKGIIEQIGTNDAVLEPVRQLKEERRKSLERLLYDPSADLPLIGE